MNAKPLYDALGTQFTPEGEATSIATSAVPNKNNVEDALKQVYKVASEAHDMASGATEVEGALGVSVYYLNTINDDKSLLRDNGWDENMTKPDSTTPYTWKKTIYTWKASDNAATTSEVATVIEICALALYPETLVMYAATTLVHNTDVTGPSDYTNDASGIADKTASGVVWYDHFKGINGTTTLGYMATRHRDAGKAWPANGGWNVALFAVYPTSQS